MDVAMLLQHESPDLPPLGVNGSSSSSTATLKRRASPSLEDSEPSTSRKRRKEDMDDADNTDQAPETTTDPPVDGKALADDLEQELQCGCCSALVYRPVVVAPCQHFFCGSCIVLWIKNGGTNCPACRGLSSSVTPSRALQTIADVLVRAVPSRARTANERMQADEIYKAGAILRIPSPRQASPEPSIPVNNNFVQPCPHCLPGNQWGWRCPQPVVDPEVDQDGAWRTDDGNPPGHAYCGNCESLLALQAPSTTKCDFCQVSFCGIGIPGRCIAAPILAQHLHSLSDLSDLIQCGAIYDVFDGNTVEVDILFDYLQAQNLTPRHIYREIVAMILRSPRQFAPLIENELFVDVHAVSGGVDADPSAPRDSICRVCATEVLLWGLREWWVQERKKGFLEQSVTKRPDCPDGNACDRQKNHAHAKEYNHIVGIPDVREEQLAVAPQPIPREALLAALAMPLPVLPVPGDPSETDAQREDSSELDGNVSLPDMDAALHKQEEPAAAPMARQSSIFKLLSTPAAALPGPSNAPSTSEPESLMMSTQEEVEAML